MVSLHQKDASNFEEKLLAFPAIFAKALNRFEQISFNNKNVDSLNLAASKKVEPSLNDREEKIWAQWKNLLKDSSVS